ALVKRAIVVSNESDLLNAFDAIGDDNDLTQIDLLITNDITLSSPFTIPSEWSSKGIVIENNSSESEVTITGFSVGAGGATLKGVIVEALPPPPLPQSVHINAITAGYDHSHALSIDGKVYATGRNHFGRLGLGDSGEGTERNIFTLVPSLNGVNVKP
ncbi:MAG: hypothetical protein LBO72_01170, partial [Helicobacteraceae bacterium]|nr:hypothetical protein [Helicobacteraceae bacterium]